MYTELIFGATLKEDTPDKIINVLNYMLGKVEVKPIDFPLSDGRCECLFKGSSYYFAVNNPVNNMWKDRIDEQYHISTRSNIKNYSGEIEEFLEWIKPYIEQGSGSREMYAIVIHEGQAIPTMYYLDNEEDLE